MERVYLLLGPEKGLRSDFIKKIKDSMGDCEVSRFYAFEDYEDQLYAQLGSDDLFAEKKLIILDEVQEIKTKDKINPLVSYIKNPSDNIVIILSSPEFRVNNEIMSSIPNQKEGIQRFYELFDNRKEDWVRAFFNRNGIKASPDAVSGIIGKVENNIGEFEVVCSQLAMYVKNVENRDTLTGSDVEEFLTHTKGEDEFSLFGFLAAGDLERSLECLKVIVESSDSASLITLIPVRLSYYFRRALSLSVLSRSMSLEEAFKSRYYDDDRPVSSIKQKDAYKKALRTYSGKDLERIMVLLSEYDLKIKDGGRLQEIMLEKCILEIVKGKGRHSQQVSFLKMKS